jgi:hypothetical protein
MNRLKSCCVSLAMLAGAAILQPVLAAPIGIGTAGVQTQAAPAADLLRVDYYWRHGHRYWRRPPPPPPRRHYRRPPPPPPRHYDRRP